MAQATLESAADEAAAADAPAANLSADDLLSKMAGAEIDRLLNEAESDHAPAAPAAAPVQAQTSTTAAEDDALASQLDELIGAMETATPAAAPQAAAAEAAPAASPAPAETAAPSADAAEAERMKVLASELEVDKPAAAAPAVPVPAIQTEAAVTEPAPQPAAEKIPIWMYPLILINAPFFFLPERIREFAGKAALLTMVNAAAVMIYVAVFRHH
jgi:2-oxoglutarate dehydrogenase E2 component (dihydrolipoamide succinyltransferase)